MRVLSVRQPWASLIVSGRKTIELRSWSTTYRGPVLILSGSRPWKGDHGFDLGPLGVSVCVVTLENVRSVEPGDDERACLTVPEGFGYAWVLSGARPVEQIPVKGKLGLYRPDERLEALFL